MNLIWATRGRIWGFRFLLDGGCADPLPTYDSAFAGTEGERSVFRQTGSLVAVRFADPDNRRDNSGRLIPHDLVVLAPLARDIQTVEDAQGFLWPLLANGFAQLWERARPPSPMDVQRALRRNPGAVSR